MNADEKNLQAAVKQLSNMSQTDLAKRIVQLERQIASLMAEERPYIFPAKKQGTDGFIETTVSGTNLTPFVSGGRSSSSTSDPVSPVDLGQDDFVLLEHPTEGKIKTIRIAGGAIRDIRYNIDNHNLQVTYKSNPTEPDWVNKVQFDSCTPSSLTGGEENRIPAIGVLNSEYLYRESEGVAPPYIGLTGLGEAGLGI